MSPTVLCLGEVLFDCLADQLGKPYEEVESWTPYPGGAPANVACALTKLGTPAGFLGCVGSDEAGDRLVKVLEDVGVDTTGVQRHPDAPTRQVYVVRSDEGDREFAGFGEFESGDFADTRLNADDVPESLFEAADFLVMGTLEMAYPDSQAAIARACGLAKKHDVRILIDINWRPVFWSDSESAKAAIRKAIFDVDILKIADDEADWLFGTSDVKEIERQLPAVANVLVTRGDRGCSYRFGKVTGDLAAFDVAVQDTTGAGDGFVAGFVHQLQQQGDASLGDPEVVRAIVRYASAVGAIATMQPGAIAAQPSSDRVEAFLNDRA